MKGSDFMKKANIIAVFVIALAMLVLCCGCTAALQNLENAEARQRTEEMLDALITDDFRAAYSLVSKFCTEEEFAPTFTQMQELLGDSDAYELKLLSIYTNSTISNGQKNSSVESVYKMTTKRDTIIVNITIDGLLNLSSFYLTPYENTDYYSNGTIQNMTGATGAQWILLLLNVVILGVTVFAIFDCCCHKIKNKVLWILLLIFGFVSVGATMSDTGTSLNFNIGWIIAYSALIRYGSGTLMIRLMLPVGVIIYFIARHSLMKESATTVVDCEKEPETLREESFTDQQSSQPSTDEKTQLE